jgi:hypothetical protein
MHNFAKTILWGGIKMLFENLTINRVTIHEIFKRNKDKSLVPPHYSQALETLSSEAIGAFRLRMSDALSEQSQSLEMQIAKFGAGSFLDHSEALVGSNDSVFFEGSKAVTKLLAEAQTSQRWPGGMVIVFDGTVGAQSKPFIGVIKAETQAGFRRSKDGDKTIIEFLQNIFLTPATRLYKIGVVIFEDTSKPKPDGRKAYVFDSNISKSDREAAATYFYDSFLGCAFPSNGAYETNKFFDLTKDFIKNSGLPSEKRQDLMSSLYVFVRDEQDATFTTDQFGCRYLPLEMQDGYAGFLAAKKFTASAVVRDISLMGNKLRRRKLRYGEDIELSASPDALKNKIQFQLIPDDQGNENSWTQITIRERLTGEL